MFPLMRRKPPGPLNILEQEELHYLRIGVYLYKLKVDLGVQPLSRLGDLCMRSGVNYSLIAVNDTIQLYLMHQFNDGLTYYANLEYTCEKLLDINKLFEGGLQCFQP